MRKERLVYFKAVTLTVVAGKGQVGGDKTTTRGEK